MIYCPNCGQTLESDARFCFKCGYILVPDPPAPQNQPAAYSYEYQAQPVQNQNNDKKTLITITKIFMVVGCISIGWLILPLAWCLPMTISYFHKVDRGEPISTSFKVCSLLFVNIIAGVLMLCSDNI